MVTRSLLVILLSKNFKNRLVLFENFYLLFAPMDCMLCTVIEHLDCLAIVGNVKSIHWLRHLRLSTAQLFLFIFCAAYGCTASQRPARRA